MHHRMRARIWRGEIRLSHVRRDMKTTVISNFSQLNASLYFATAVPCFAKSRTKIKKNPATPHCQGSGQCAGTKRVKKKKIYIIVNFPKIMNGIKLPMMLLSYVLGYTKETCCVCVCAKWYLNLNIFSFKCPEYIKTSHIHTYRCLNLISNRRRGAKFQHWICKTVPDLHKCRTVQQKTLNWTSKTKAEIPCFLGGGGTLTLKINVLWWDSKNKSPHAPLVSYQK